MTDLRANLTALQSRIARAASKHGRDPKDVALVAVSKQQPDDRIDAALAAGLRTFGENRVQEAQGRWTARKPSLPDLRLHLIGPLQTNKARDAVALFDAIETLDSPRLADALKAAMEKQGLDIPCFIQVNTGEEPQKAGVAPADFPALLTHALNLKLTITGLMCIPPADEPPAPHFALLRKLAQRYGLKQLSMGMSADFETAVALGATYVRLGAALFGERPTGTTTSGPSDSIR